MIRPRRTVFEDHVYGADARLGEERRGIPDRIAAEVDAAMHLVRLHRLVMGWRRRWRPG